MAGPVLLQNPGSWVTTGNPATVNDALPLFAPGQVGTYCAVIDDIPIPSQPNALPPGAFPRIYQYVQLSASSATPAFGQVVCWSDAISPVVVTGITAALRSRPAGIVVNASATLGNYIWILVSGVGPGLEEAATAGSIGDTVIVGGTTAGRIDNVAAGTAPTHPSVGVYLTAAAATFNGSSALPAGTAAILYNFPRPGAL